MVGWLARNLSQQLYLENDGSFGFTGDGRFQGSNRSPIPDARKTECSCHVRRKRKHNPRLPRAPPRAVSHSISPKATRLHAIKKKESREGVLLPSSQHNKRHRQKPDQDHYAEWCECRNRFVVH